ncbi:MAG: mevalonate kinase [Propioniciclava sp.]|uniref:mevalonate kinase n=1 Tax=Propioniciclava sp. TaxID=2038686 RepID=UPI0039E4BB77
MTPHTGLGHAVAKIILFGEHSVVYGYPAIALPLRSLRMTARAEPFDDPNRRTTLTSLGWSGPMTEAPAHFASILRAVAVATEFAGRPDAGIDISTHSEFPAQRGLGSSAAAAGAVIRAILDAYDVPATPQEIFHLTQEAERIAHGRPSGLDAMATSANAPVHFQAGTTTELDFALEAWIVIADSGIQGSTRETVGNVRSLYETSPETTRAALARLGSITEEAVDDLRAGNIAPVGAKMTQAHGLLAGLGVSNAPLDALVAAALEAGALGAKLTGGGGGGCVIALASTREEAQRVEAALIAAGARATWLHAPSAGEVAA